MRGAGSVTFEVSEYLHSRSWLAFMSFYTHRSNFATLLEWLAIGKDFDSFGIRPWSLWCDSGKL